MKSWQIFYCELKVNGEWFQGKQPIKILFDEKKANRIFDKYKKNAGINQKYVMAIVDGDKKSVAM